MAHVETCNHIKTNGEFCESPALRNDRYCYFHRAQRERVKAHARAARQQQPLELPLLEDLESVHLAIGDVLNALLQKRLDTKTAGLLLYGLQTAVNSVQHCQFNVEDYDHRVTNYTEYEQVTLQEEIDLEQRAELQRQTRNQRRALQRSASKATSSAPENPAFATPDPAEPPATPDPATTTAVDTAAPAVDITNPVGAPSRSDRMGLHVTRPPRPSDLPQSSPRTGPTDELFWKVVGDRATQNAASLTRDLLANLKAADTANENLAAAKKKPQSVAPEDEQKTTTA